MSGLNKLDFEGTNNVYIDMVNNFCTNYFPDEGVKIDTNLRIGIWHAIYNVMVVADYEKILEFTKYFDSIFKDDSDKKSFENWRNLMFKDRNKFYEELLLGIRKVYPKWLCQNTSVLISLFFIYFATLSNISVDIRNCSYTLFQKILKDTSFDYTQFLHFTDRLNDFSDLFKRDITMSAVSDTSRYYDMELKFDSISVSQHNFLNEFLQDLCKI